MPTSEKEERRVKIISAKFSVTTGSSIAASLSNEEKEDGPRIGVIPTATVLLQLQNKEKNTTSQGTAIGGDVIEAIFLATKRALESYDVNIIGNYRLRRYEIEEGEFGSFATVLVGGKKGKQAEGVMGVDTPGKGLEVFFDALVAGLTKLLKEVNSGRNR